jgi:hypothetical protein
MSTNKEDQKAELRKKLKAAIGEKKINRNKKQNKETILKNTLAEMGIDSEKLKEDLEKVNKEKGFSININE